MVLERVERAEDATELNRGKTIMNFIRHHWTKLTALVLIVVLSIFIMTQNNNTEIQSGGLYSVETSKGEIKIVKVLVVDPNGVHIRLYKNIFTERPTSVDQAELKLGRFDDPEGFSIGHLPITKEVLFRSKPVFIQSSTVTQDELDGYEMWKEASSTYWTTGL